MKLKGIMEAPLRGFLIFRGFADFEEIARISKPDESYQRDTIEEHIKGLKDFLENKRDLFFPEVILGCDLPESDEEIERLGEFYSAFRNNQKGNFDFRKLNIGIQKPKPYGDSTFKVATLSTLKKSSDENIFFRIDGNHRITAFEELSKTNNELFKTPISICIIFFRTKEEYQKQSKIIFHNLNFKSTPLSMEQSLKLIFNDKDNFGDEVLKNDKSFGMPYYYAKEVFNEIDLDKYFVNLKNMFEGEPRTSFLNFFTFLKEKGIKLEDNEEKVEEFINLIRDYMNSINEIFKKESKLKETKKCSLCLAFLYYYIETQGNNKKIEFFTQWVLKNHIYKSTTDLKNLIKVFDEIYASRIKKIFVAMPFREKTNDNVWDSMVEVYNELIKEGYDLSQQHKKRDKYAPYRVDIDNLESKDIIEKIKKGIEECDLIIADLTYNNPNVYYEIGLAQGQNKPLILLFDEKATEEKTKENKPRFDLSTMEHIKYDSNNLSNLKSELKEKLKNILNNICEPT